MQKNPKSFEQSPNVTKIIIKAPETISRNSESNPVKSRNQTRKKFKTSRKNPYRSQKNTNHLTFLFRNIAECSENPQSCPRYPESNHEKILKRPEKII